ncbi:hypothetical protein PTTG_11638, partial [Puccinia triticina 1-1 BBBD Race 1]
MRPPVEVPVLRRPPRPLAQPPLPHALALAALQRPSWPAPPSSASSTSISPRPRPPTRRRSTVCSRSPTSTRRRHRPRRLL